MRGRVNWPWARTINGTLYGSRVGEKVGRRHILKPNPPRSIVMRRGIDCPEIADLGADGALALVVLSQLLQRRHLDMR